MSPQFPCRTKGQRSTPEESKAGFLLLPLPSELLPEGVLEPSLLAPQAGALLCHVTDPMHSAAGLRADRGGSATVGGNEGGPGSLAPLQMYVYRAPHLLQPDSLQAWPVPAASGVSHHWLCVLSNWNMTLYLRRTCLR